MTSILLSNRTLLDKTTHDCYVDVQTNVTVHKENEMFVLNATNLDYESMPSSASSHFRNRSLTFSHHEMERLPHDLVLTLFTSSAPRPISETVLRRHDTHDKKTPDLIQDDLIFEIGTNLLGSSFAYDEKIEKYDRLARDREVKYFVLGVGTCNVTCNFDMNPDEIQKVVECYLLGRRIQSQATKHGFTNTRTHTNMDKYMTFSMKNIDTGLIPEVLTTIPENTWNDWATHQELEGTFEDKHFYDELRQRSYRDTMNRIKGYLKGDNVDFDRKLRDEYVKSVGELPTKPADSNKKLPIPFCLIRQGEFNDKGIMGPGNPMANLWCNIYGNREPFDEPKSYDELCQMIKTPEEEEEERNSKEHKKEMLKKDRWVFELDENDSEDLARKGLNAKSILKNEIRLEKQEHNVQRSLGYSLTEDYDLTDIEAFIKSDTLLNFHKPNELWESISQLLYTGDFNISEKSVKYFRDFFNTKLGHCTTFLHSLFSELNVNLRKPTKKNEFIIKRMPNYACLLGIHNTGSKKHTFYTLLVHKDDIIFDESLAFFRPWYVCGDYYVLDLCSTRRHDVSNLLYSHSKILTLLATHCEVFSNPLQMDKPINCMQEVLFHTLVYLENSNQTSETLQQIRFFYMKTNCSKIVPEPILAPLEKLPKIIRSRLCLWATKRILVEFLKMSDLRQKLGHVKTVDNIEGSEEEVYSEDMLTGVLSYVSGQPLKNYEEALLLSYGGIYHNKEKSDANAASLQIFRKLTKEELKMNPELKDKYINGFDEVNAEEMPPHGFSATHVRNCGVAFKDELKTRGIDMQDFNQKAGIELGKITFEEMATFKASHDSSHLEKDAPRGEYADLNLDREAYDNNDRYKYGGSVRALEGILNVLDNVHLDENVKPFHVISSLVNECNKRGGIVTILFKKAQFGSVREIFILTMFARIVIRFVESLARTVCEHLPNEYLTKGGDKLNSTPTHFEKVRNVKAKNDKTLNVFDSLDCKTWCQNFTFPVFGNLFSVIFSDWPEASEVIRNVFNMASAKRHELKEDLMKLFERHPEERSMEESLNVLKDEFLGDGGMLNNGNKSIFCKNVSNFMQGIFHYTSSALHSCHLILMSKMIVAYMRNGDFGVKNVIHTTKASSDDSSSLLTVVYTHTDKETELKLRIKLLSCSEFLCRSYPLMCAKIGEPKSTRFVENGVEEFNSSWSYRNTVLSVPSKFTTAAVCSKITRSTVERLRVDHSSVNSCIENGCSYSLSRVVELCCALNHYENIGLSTTSKEVWSRLSRDIIDLANPSTYLYIASPPIIGTTLGYDATLHNYLSKHQISARTQYVVEKLFAGSLDLKSGLLVQSSIVVGNTKKYKDFLKRIGGNDKYETACKMVEENPVILYRDSCSADEIRCKIMLKAKSSGAERAFIFEDESAMHVTSTYLVTAPSLTVSMRKQGEWERSKMSLPAFLNEVKNRISAQTHYPPVDKFTESIIEMTSQYDVKKINYIGRRRKLPVKVKFPKFRGASELPLMSVIKFLWFALQNGCTKEENMTAFHVYRTQCSWLRDTYEETCEHIKSLGITDNPAFVINTLIMDEVDKDRTISFLHTGKRDSTIINTFLRCLEYNYEREHRLVRPNDFYASTEMGLFNKVEEELYPYIMLDPMVRRIISNLPEEEFEESVDACTRIIRKHKELFLKERQERDIRFLPSRTRGLLAIGTSLLSDDDKRVKQNVLDYGPGYIITYLTPQNRVTDEEGRVRWEGWGEFFVETKMGNFILEAVDNKLTKIKTNHPTKTVQYSNILTKVLRTLRLNSDNNSRNIQDGMRCLNGKWMYSPTVGTKSEQLTFSSDIHRPEITKLLEIKPRCLQLKIQTEAVRVGRCDSEPIRFSPEIINHEENKMKLDKVDAAQLLSIVNKRPADDPVRKFVAESISDRASRLELTAKKNLGKLITNAETLDESLASDKFEDDMSIDFETFDDDVDVDDLVQLMFNKEASEMGETDSEGNVDMMDIFADENEINLESIIEDSTMTKYIDPESRSIGYEELCLWDDFLLNTKKLLKFTFTSLSEGDYVMPDRKNDIRTVLKVLVSLNIIPEPKQENFLSNKRTFNFLQRWEDVESSSEDSMSE